MDERATDSSATNSIIPTGGAPKSSWQLSHENLRRIPYCELQCSAAAKGQKQTSKQATANTQHPTPLICFWHLTMALLASPSAAFPAIAGSPMGVAPQSESGSVMSGSMNWEPVRKRLLGPDLKDALEAATELREGIEIVHTVEFPLLLSALLPAFSTILAHRTSPSPDTSTVEHKLRNVVLEIISRMPSNEILRPHAPHLVAVALDILNRDYEENALLASRIVFDLYKVYRNLPQDYIQPYLDFVQNSYRALPGSVQRNFSFSALAVVPPDAQSKQASNSAPNTVKEASAEGPEDKSKDTASPAPATPGPVATKETAGALVATPPTGITTSSPSMSKIPVTPTPRLSPKSNSSFRVLTECPLVVMLMFQLYPKFLRSNIPGLINVMMEALALRAPSIESITKGHQPLDANASRLYFSRCRELVAAQAKTLSFLTYLLRGFSNDLKPYEERLASNVVALMSTCPREFISTRKELLVATRHLLNSEFRNGFFPHVDALLDERVLMGSHHRYSEQTVLRPLGYTTLSDLVHHVRSKLNLNQISKVVSIFSRVLHDSSMVLPMSTQYTAVRTLLSVVDIVFNNKDRDPQIGRDILVRILKTLVDKLSALHSCRELVSQQRTEESKSEGLGIDSTGLCVIEQLELPVGSDPNESLRDLKSMIRAIIVGHKTLIWYINKYRGQREQDKAEIVPPKPGTNEEVSSAMLKITHTEHALIDRYIQLAFPCMKWLKDDEPTDSGPGSGERSSSDHYRDALSYFAAAFTVLDGYDLRRTLGRRLEELVDAVTDDPAAIVVPRHLLAANATTSFEFCTLLLDFLVERLNKLDTSLRPDVHFLPPSDNCDLNDVDRVKIFMATKTTSETKEEMSKKSSAYLQLFERVLKSLSTFPENERALRPHLKSIVAICLQASMEKTDFKLDNHCMLLRYVFRSISAGKFEESYRELLPLIPTVLNGLFRIFRATDDPFLHHTIIELLLTIPARLSSLLPHMNLLLRVIVSALESKSGDLVNLG
jgi:transformation/transcription domain-associated protein